MVAPMSWDVAAHAMVRSAWKVVEMVGRMAVMPNRSTKAIPLAAFKATTAQINFVPSRYFVVSWDFVGPAMVDDVKRE